MLRISQIDHAARARRRRRDDVVAAVVAFDRRQLARRVLVQVGLRDDALARLAARDDRAGHRPLVETGSTVFADQLQRLREVLLHQLLAGLEWLAVVQKDRRRGRVLFEIFSRGHQHIDVALLEHEAVLRVLDRRGDQRGALHRAVLRARAISMPDTVPGTPTARWPLVLAPLTTLPSLSRYMLAVAASGAFSRKSRKVLRPSAS